MTTLTGEEAVTRFKENEERIDTFVNSPTGYTTTPETGSQPVESVQEFLTRKDNEINVSANGILAQTEAARDDAQAAQLAAETAAANLPNASTGGANKFLQTNATGDGWDYHTVVQARHALNLGFVVSPLDYGSTVDSSTLQSAIDAAISAGGGIVFLPEGTYTISSEVLHNSTTAVTIQGIGRRQTVLQASGNFNSILRFGSLSVGSQIRNIDFYASNTTTKCINLDTNSVDISFHECRFRGDTASLNLVFSEAAGFIEWHNCHFVMNNATTLGLHLDSHNQVWRLVNCRFSGIGRPFKTSNTNSDVEGGRCIGTHFVSTGDWAVSLGASFDTVFDDCSFDQQTTSGIILGENADRVSISNSFFGAPSGNATSKLIDVTATSGNHMSFVNNTFLYGAAAIQCRATASPGEYLDGLQVLGNKFIGQASTCLQLDSVTKAVITNNVDKGTPANGSWITSNTNSVNGDYTFDNNKWHTQAPNVFSTSASYEWGSDTGIRMRNSGTSSASSTTALVVAHGLSRTPSFVLGMPTLNVGNFWNSAKDPTNISFTWVTSSSPDIHWQVEV